MELQAPSDNVNVCFFILSESYFWEQHYGFKRTLAFQYILFFKLVKSNKSYLVKEMSLRANECLKSDTNCYYSPLIATS
jgi:hypothetical protein